VRRGIEAHGEKLQINEGPASGLAAHRRLDGAHARLWSWHLVADERRGALDVAAAALPATPRRSNPFNEDPPLVTMCASGPMTMAGTLSRESSC
jgi:hypothetical protein